MAADPERSGAHPADAVSLDAGGRCRARIRYTAGGVVFGACFPAVSWLLLAFLTPAEAGAAAPSLWESVVWLHSVNPLLWVIDTAPVFLGIFAHIAGLQQDRICALNTSLQTKVEARTRSLRETLTQLESELDVRQKLEEKLRHQALHDPLTGLANRALLRDRLSHTLRRTARKGLWDVGVLFLDLDRFKHVNDTLGHAVGDALLVQVAERLLSATRGSDTVARMGGDEFAVVLAEGQAAQGAVIVAERIAQAFRDPFCVGDHIIPMGVSIGIATSCPGEDECEVLRNADLAMYQAKQRGRNRYVVYDPSMQDGVMGC